MRAGRFYASSGVRLSEVDFDSESDTLQLTIDGEADVQYETQFIATRKPQSVGANSPYTMPPRDAIGVVVGSSDSLTPRYQLTGDELYVRAVVTSSQPHPDPSFADQHQQAWTQPVGWSLPAPPEAAATSD